MTIILDNYPPSTLQGVGLGCRKNPRVIVVENYCHFGAPYCGRVILGSEVVIPCITKWLQTDINNNFKSIYELQLLTVSGSTLTPWSGPFRA